MTSGSFQPAARPARRTVVAAAGAAGLAAALTACGGSDDTSDDAVAAATSPEAAGTDAGSSGGAALASTSDIPEGGGKVFADRKVVVTQPSPGEFKAFSATCTHQGCAVKNVADGVINCPCHNSNLSITDGSVSSGPAREPLPAVQITVDGESITLA